MRGRLTRCVLLLSLLAAPCLGAKVKQPSNPFFPRIDANGSATLTIGGEGVGRITLNTKNGKLVFKAIGQTTNESNAKQTFKNDPVVNEFYGAGPPPLEISRSRLKVSAEGAVNLLVKATMP